MGGQQQLQLTITYIYVSNSIVLNISSQLKQREKLSQIQIINIYTTQHNDPSTISTLAADGANTKYEWLTTIVENIKPGQLNNYD